MHYEVRILDLYSRSWYYKEKFFGVFALYRHQYYQILLFLNF